MTRTPEPETIDLPAELVGRLETAFADRDESAEVVVETLVKDYLSMRHSIETYVETAETAGTRKPNVEHLMDVPPPVGNLLGFTLNRINHGRAELSFTAGPEHANPMGTLHGASSVTSAMRRWESPSPAH